jgi:DNA polymerase-1
LVRGTGGAGVKLLLIDAHALVHRAFHGIRDPRLIEGMPTNAVYGFASMLLTVLERERPTHIALAFEGGVTFRNEAFPGYKAGRKPMPDELRCQLPYVHGLAVALGISRITQAGLEADDVMAIFAKQAYQHGLPVVIITGDKDLLQLVDSNTTVMLPEPGGPFSSVKAYNEDAVIEKFGFPPAYMADFKALAGDASDNIPGVNGIGEKGAVTLVNRYGSIECMVKLLSQPAVNQPRDRNEKRFMSDWESAVLYKKITTLVTEAPDANLLLEPDKLKFGEVDTRRAVEWFSNMGMQNLLGKFMAVVA